MKMDDAREKLAGLIAENGDDYAGLSRLVDRNAAYIQQYIKRGTPRRLPERERGILARYYNIDERMLGAPQKAAAENQMQLIPKLEISASAGSGTLDVEDSLAGKVGFDPKWLNDLCANPNRLSFIQVAGDSMAPTLNHGDDIMVEAAQPEDPLKEGIYVLRMDDTLVVKRVALAPSGAVSVRSDNPEWPSWENVNMRDIRLIGRVVWAGRRL